MKQTFYDKEIIEKDKIIKEMQQIANELGCVLEDYAVLINKDIDELRKDLVDLKLNQSIEEDLEDDLEDGLGL